MKLLDIEVVLNRDKGIQQARRKSQVMEELDDMTTSYAILSHRWGAEVSYEEMIGFTKMEEEERGEVKQRDGYQKIIKSCEQAKKDGYEWLWIDTCCIDKRSSSELSEAINSMYRWYQNAQVCYAYFNDVGESTFPTKRDNNKFNKSNGWPEWFVRGWTLQELIAPKQVKFFNKNWVYIGDKQSSARELEEITGIPCDVLMIGLAAKRLSVAQITSWAADRKTTRVEDRAYSLMGLLGVNMPMLYGEGKKAFQRLQLEIIRVSSDHSIFAWKPPMLWVGSVLAEDPSGFRGCGRIRRLEPDEFVTILKRKYIEGEGADDIESRARRQHKLAALRGALDFHQFHTVTLSNAGIQVFLPVIPSECFPSHLRATLACTHNGDLVTISLVPSGGSFARASASGDGPLPATYPDFKTLRLIHHQDSNKTRHDIVLDDKLVSYHGFTRCGTYPNEFTGNTVTPLSLVVANDLIVIVYANHYTRCRFAIGLGYSLGREWVHVVEDGDFLMRKEEHGSKFGWRVYGEMLKAHVKHAQIMPKHDACRYKLFIKHAHFPQSIWAARVAWGGQPAGDFKVIIDVVQCPGCCDVSCGWAAASTGLAMPKLMATVSGSYLLELDGRPTRLSKCFGQRLALGDYGDYSRGNFVCTGNIFDDMPATGIDFDDSHRRAIYSVSSSKLGGRLDWVKTQDILAVENKRKRTTYLALHQPAAISLPDNEHISLLLKALSARLAGKHLVTTVIQCLDFYAVDKDGKLWNSSDYSAPNSGNYSTGTGVLTPLCTISYPHVWSIDPPCKQTKKRFKSIRRNFYILMDMHQPAGTQPSRDSAVRRTTMRGTRTFPYSSDRRDRREI
ncbi:heterokaryon incompatibility protein-domain-containing protein [Pisolithus thermaeus]|nr:heterokaryon incompatibility protein-domain-containing protein [Pisolithus thermaeus]